MCFHWYCMAGCGVPVAVAATWNTVPTWPAEGEITTPVIWGGIALGFLSLADRMVTLDGVDKGQILVITRAVFRSQTRSAEIALI